MPTTAWFQQQQLSYCTVLGCHTGVTDRFHFIYLKKFAFNSRDTIALKILFVPNIPVQEFICIMYIMECPLPPPPATVVPLIAKVLVIILQTVFSRVTFADICKHSGRGRGVDGAVPSLGSTLLLAPSCPL